MSKLNQFGAEAILWGDSDYPSMLAQTVNPPPALYTFGDKTLLNSPSVAMVGSRAATVYGRRVAFSLAGDLAQRSVTVVSGLAAGIDAEAHAGCLAVGGKTIGVLGCGLDVVYPRANKNLYSQISRTGLLVSEYTLGTRPEGFRFPARNRIIAGVSSGVLVVEAAKRSGSLITVQIALEEGREVFAVPGQIDSIKSGGTHWLLQQGAGLVVSADDIISSLRLQVDGKTLKNGKRGQGVLHDLDSVSRELLSLINSYPIQRDELVRLSGMAPAKLSEHLLLLELEGLVELLPGDEVCRMN